MTVLTRHKPLGSFVAVGLLGLGLLASSGWARAAELPLNTVLMRDGDIEVSVADFEAALKRVPESKRAALRSERKRGEQVIESVFVTRMLAQQASDSGVADGPVVAARLRQQREQLLSELQLKSMRESLDRDKAATLARERFQANRDRYRQPAQAHVQHILIGSRQRSDKEAQKLASRLVERLRDNPDAFTKFVRKYSDDTGTAKDAGELKPFAKGEMVKPFEEAAFDLEVAVPHLDLMYPCKTLGLTGGLKRIEREIGLERERSDISGRDAVRLWHEHEAGVEGSLETLISYNREDAVNLEALADEVTGRLHETVFEQARRNASD